MVIFTLNKLQVMRNAIKRIALRAFTKLKISIVEVYSLTKTCERFETESPSKPLEYIHSWLQKMFWINFEHRLFSKMQDHYTLS